jgi:hypothetical protein
MKQMKNEAKKSMKNYLSTKIKGTGGDVLKLIVDEEKELD